MRQAELHPSAPDGIARVPPPSPNAFSRSSRYQRAQQLNSQANAPAPPATLSVTVNPNLEPVKEQHEGLPSDVPPAVTIISSTPAALQIRFIISYKGHA